VTGGGAGAAPGVPWTLEKSGGIEACVAASTGGTSSSRFGATGLPSNQASNTLRATGAALEAP
jgi:hypothetical protein